MLMDLPEMRIRQVGQQVAELEVRVVDCLKRIVRLEEM